MHGNILIFSDILFNIYIYMYIYIYIFIYIYIYILYINLHTRSSNPSSIAGLWKKPPYPGIETDKNRPMGSSRDPSSLRIKKDGKSGISLVKIGVLMLDSR